MLVINWCSIAGQTFDFLGFAILTYDLFPDFAGSRIRDQNTKLSESFVDVLDSIFARHIQSLPELLAGYVQTAVNFADEKRLGSKYFLTLEDEVRDAIPTEAFDALSTAERRQIKDALPNLERLRRLRSAIRTERFSEMWFPTPRDRDTIEQSISAADRGSFILKARAISQKVANEKRAWRKWKRLDAVPEERRSISAIIAASDAVAELDRYLAQRWRPPLGIAIALIVLGFAAQILGSISTEPAIRILWVGWLG